jgi:hypothetical protein
MRNRFQLTATPWLLEAALLKRLSPFQSSLRRLDKSGADAECFVQYTGVEHHKSYAGWQSNKNATHYSPISPEYREALWPIAANVAHGMAITTGGDLCREDRLDYTNAEMWGVFWNCVSGLKKTSLR